MNMLQLTLPGGVTINNPEGLGVPDGKGGHVIPKDLGDIIMALIPYALSIAGLILFVLIMWGGFQMLTAAGSEEKVAKGRSAITSGIIGFVIVFFAYWIMQLMQKVFGFGLGFTS